MTVIGIFEKLNDGMSGTIATLTINARVRFVPVLSAEAANAPSFRIFAEKIEVGAAWKKVSATSGREYLSCKIDDPSLATPIFASLVDVENEPGDYALIWSRRRVD